MMKRIRRIITHTDKTTARKRLTKTLVARSGTPGVRKVTVLNSPGINAFALPGGYIYVTRGLLALANDEAELAMVIAHEIGHQIGDQYNLYNHMLHGELAVEVHVPSR